MALSAVDLFCGAGGLSAGFIDGGIDVVGAFDNWRDAINTYRRNLSDHVAQIDLADTDTATFQIVSLCPDIIAGGPPCQDFSSAGKRVEGYRANLTNAFGEIVTKCTPQFFLMENVPQVRRSGAYTETKEILIASGYEIAEIILDACHYGVPQSRKRFFAFGSLRKNVAARFAQFVKKNISEKSLTVKEYFGRDIEIDFYYRHPRNYSRRSVFSVYEPSPTIRGVNRPVPPGYQGNRLDSAPPSTVRALTSFERSRIQTFPKEWDWKADNRNTSVEKQIGNAVPVNLACVLATGIRYADRAG